MRVYATSVYTYVYLHCIRMQKYTYNIHIHIHMLYTYIHSHSHAITYHTMYLQIHAMGTLSAIVMPCLLPACATLVEQGCYSINGTNRRNFLVVSPDGLIVLVLISFMS